MQSSNETIRASIRASIAVKTYLLEDEVIVQQLSDVAWKIVDSIRSGGKVILMGNGGSAADAQHLAAELTGRYLLDRTPWPALCLHGNSSAVTSIANDYGYELVFARQLEALGKAGDVAIGLSTSGNSGNVLRALEVARKKGMLTIGMTGRSGGKMADLTEQCIRVPSDETPRIQECHILLGHVICELVEKRMSCQESAVQK
jgi:D-sedoheptulose 7-phosphate isomerase